MSQQDNGKRIVSDASTVTGGGNSETPLHERSAAAFVGWGFGLALGGPLASAAVLATSDPLNDTGVVGFAVFLNMLAIVGAIVLAVGIYRLACKADAAYKQYATAGSTTSGHTAQPTGPPAPPKIAGDPGA